MKKNQTSTCLTASTQIPERTSLFMSIVDNECQQMIEFDCQKFANRVGLIRKILVNRNLDDLRWEFDNKVSELIEDFANRIDNELYKTKENS